MEKTAKPVELQTLSAINARSIVETCGHTGVVTGAGGGDGFIKRLARDEAARHAARGAIGSNPVGESLAFRELEECRTEHAEAIMAAWNA